MMITELSQLQVGMTLFDTIKADMVKRITEVTMVRDPVSHADVWKDMGYDSEPPKLLNKSMWIMLRDKRGHEQWQSCGDRGVGANHNNNRFFTTREEAEAHLKK